MSAPDPERRAQKRRCYAPGEKRAEELELLAKAFEDASLTRVLREIRRWRNKGRTEIVAFGVAELGRRFKIEHDITDDEFESDHWQTLFKIQYPEAW